MRLDTADGPDWDTVVKCSHGHELPKARATERRGPVVVPMVFLFDSSGTENAEAGSGMGVELLVDFGVGDVGKVLG